jgi:hypothetical protein
MGLFDIGQGFPVIGCIRLSEIISDPRRPVYKDLNFRFRFRRQRPIAELYAAAAKAGSITV